MIPSCVVKEAEKTGAHYMYQKGALQSVDPAETMFGFTVWAHLIPPVRPENTLILGYGGGTVAELMRKIWGGQLKITGVDTEAQNYKYVEYRMKIMDAKDYLLDCTKDRFFKNTIPIIKQEKFDYVCVDLWDGDKACDFVFETEFVVRLREIATKLVSMNIKAEDVKRCKAYHDYGYTFARCVPVEGNQVLWWSV